jgi:hypothetical protein
MCEERLKGTSLGHLRIQPFDKKLRLLCKLSGTLDRGQQHLCFETLILRDKLHISIDKQSALHFSRNLFSICQNILKGILNVQGTPCLTELLSIGLKRYPESKISKVNLNNQVCSFVVPIFLV